MQLLFWYHPLKVYTEVLFASQATSDGKSYKQKANVLNVFQCWEKYYYKSLTAADTGHPGKANIPQLIIILQASIVENNFKIVIH